VVVKTRLEVLGFQEYSGVTDAFRQIISKEGPGGLFTGLKISLIRDVPFSGMFYPIYRSFQSYYAELLGVTGQNNSASSLLLVTSLASFSANVASCTVTHPLDLIRTRVYF
jgi:hypothetical protein